MILDIDVKVCSFNLSEEGFWHDLEKETQNTVAELRWLRSFGEGALKTMNDMHLQIQQFSVNRVLRWRMEVILHSVKLCLGNVLIKQRNGLGLKETLFGGLVSVLGVELVEEGITLFIELQRLFCINHLIIIVEYVILKSDMNFFLGL